MPQPRVRNAIMAIFLAGIGACVFFIIGLSTTLSATIQLILTIVGVSFLIISVATMCHIEPPLGHAFVIRKREDLRVVRGSTYLPFWQKIYPIQLVTSKMIEINFNQAPYPKTLDRLPVRVKVQANLTFDDSDEALIAAAKIQETIGQEKHYDDLKKDLEGIISKVLSERNYNEHIEKRNEFEKSVNEYWQSITKLHSLHRINVEIEPVKLDEAKLSEVDLSKATSTVEAIKADEDDRQAESKKKSEQANVKKTKAIEENKREKAKEESQTAIIISEEKEKEAESKNAHQHKSNMNESKRKDARDNDKFENELSRLSREKQRVNKEIEIEKAKQELSLKKADANRKVQIAEANTKLEVEWINNELFKDRIEGELDLEKQYLEIRTNELKMLKDNKDGNLRYLLAKEAISMSTEQSKAIGSALSRARIIGALKDLHQVEKMLKTPIAIREVLGEVIDVMDDEVIQGVGRFFRGVAAIRKEYQSSVVETNSSTQAASGVESEEFTPSQDGGTQSEDELPAPHNDRDFG